MYLSFEHSADLGKSTTGRFALEGGAEAESAKTACRRGRVRCCSPTKSRDQQAIQNGLLFGPDSLVLESQQSPQPHKLVNVLGGQDGLDPWFLRGGVYFVQKMLGGRPGKQRLYTREKSAFLHQIRTRIRRIIAPFVFDRRPFPQGRRSVEIDFDVCGGHGKGCYCLHT